MKTSVPDFATARLLLTPLSLEDAASYQRHFVDYEVIRHLSAQVPWPYPEDGVVAYFQSVLLPAQGVDRWTWAIRVENEPSEVIGCVDLWRKGAPENRGFWLAKRFWGRGYMTEAVAPVMDYAFDVLGFASLVFANAVGNVASRRIKEKTGARLVDVKPAAFVDPAYTQHEVWELTKEDWAEWRSKG